ncbi:hypothetical protein BGX38DRAFT_1330734 [Terfezia claveryi]|nr:hypothetical protein BGX38DRAFT_1330734 [Terfezia claveryi]
MSTTAEENILCVLIGVTVDDVDIKGTVSIEAQPPVVTDIDTTQRTVPEGSMAMAKVRWTLQKFIGDKDVNIVYVFVKFSPPPQKKDAELATLKEDHRFDLIVEPKRILSISWTVNINTATLNELKEKISKEYYPHLDSTLLRLTLKPKSSKPFSPDSDKDLRVLLRDLVQANEKVLIISVETPQKLFSECILNKVAADFLSSNSSSVPGFELASDTLEPIFIIKPQKQVTGVYGKGPVDYAIDLSNGVTVGVTEVKREENAITKGLAQNAVQIESALWESRKRKRDTCDLDGTDNNEVPNYCFGIVTNAKEWFFLKCTFVNDVEIKVEISALCKFS